MADHLAELNPQDVADWYNRLSDYVSRKKINGQQPLSGHFLKTYLNNRKPKYTHVFKAPQYLKESNYVLDVLKYHRSVFFTDKKARFTGGRFAWAGILPRLQGRSGFNTWNIKNKKTLDMEYESLVEVGTGLVDIIRIQRNGSHAEKDLLTAFRGFQLKSYVTVQGTVLTNSKVNIQFINWECEALDKYDFNYNEYFTPPNPDFGRHDLKGAVRPQDRSFRVYHKNAKRLEDAKLACPYSIRSYKWKVNDAAIVGPAEIDSTRKLT